MSAKVIVGLQWGDEGKGKFADLLSAKSDLVVRYQGGSNAGHTIKVKEDKFVLHLLPSGVINCKGYCILGAGMVVNPQSLVDEIGELKSKGIDIKIKIDLKTHILTPYHMKLDELQENSRNASNKIGTTKKGIGPCYEDKYSRRGLRFGDLLNPEYFKERFEAVLNYKNEIISNIYKDNPYELKMIDDILELVNRENLIEMIDDTTYLINDTLDKGGNVLFEGAQAIMLDIDHGSYPFVTSSSAFSGGVFGGAGISYKKINSVIGVSKAYCTRVGSGIFPTEIFDKEADKLRDAGFEYGSTTGRPRRVGFLDLVQLKYAIMLNGVDELVITKLDVLSIYDEIKVCIGYKIDENQTDRMPSNLQQISLNSKIEPIYKVFKGWKKDISEIKDFKNLPNECMDYIKFIEDYLNLKISVISVGPERDQNIFLKDINFSQ